MALIKKPGGGEAPPVELASFDVLWLCYMWGASFMQFNILSSSLADFCRALWIGFGQDERVYSE